jgi:hypothetical protein
MGVETDFGAILAGMKMTKSDLAERFRRPRLSLAVFWAVLGGIYLGIAICMIIKYAKSGDRLGEGLGFVNAFTALSLTFLGTQSIRAVFHRLVAQSRSNL